jgi:hypothetical protein
MELYRYEECLPKTLGRWCKNFIKKIIIYTIYSIYKIEQPKQKKVLKILLFFVYNLPRYNYNWFYFVL